MPWMKRPFTGPNVRRGGMLPPSPWPERKKKGEKFIVPGGPFPLNTNPHLKITAGRPLPRVWLPVYGWAFVGTPLSPRPRKIGAHWGE